MNARVETNEAERDGIIDRDDQGIPRVRYRRVLRHPVARVWAAITDAEQVMRWGQSSWNFEPRVGGAMELVLGAHRPEAVGDSGVVTAWDPPRLLQFTIAQYQADEQERGEHVLTFRLTEAPEGTVLEFTDRFAPGARVRNSIACGWHYMIDCLELDLADTPIDWSGKDAEMERLYWRYRNAPPSANVPS